MLPGHFERQPSFPPLNPQLAIDESRETGTTIHVGIKGDRPDGAAGRAGSVRAPAILSCEHPVTEGGIGLSFSAAGWLLDEIPAASLLLLAHRPLRVCSLVAPSPKPNAVQRTCAYL
jgi:hypothetical protein